MLCVLTFWRLLKIFEKMEEEVILRIAHERHVHSTIPFQMFWRLWIGFEPCRWNDINIKLNRLRLAYALAFPSWIHDVHHNALYSSVKVNQKSDCRLVKNHQFACIHVGNKGGVRSQNFRARREPSTQTWWFDLFAYHGASAAPCVYPLARSAGVFLSRFKEI